MGAAADFFVSYTSTDRAWAEWIAWQLEAEGYTVIVQAWDFTPGRDWAHEMHQATSTAERVVAVLSAAYLESAHGEAEWQAYYAKDPRGRQGQLLPVRVEEVEPPGLLTTRTYVDLVDQDAASARAALLAAARGTRGKPTEEPEFPGDRRPAGSAAEAPRFPGELPPVWNVPYRRNPAFTGREEVLATLARQLGQGAAAAVTQAIQGAGGIGKTAVATEYAWQQRADFEVVWWVQAEEPTTLVGDLADLAAAMELPEAAQADQQLAVGGVRRWLEDHDRWLLVLDNAQGPQTATGLLAPLEHLANVLPRVVHGQVLVTSRDASWDSQATLIELDLLSSQEAIRFLLLRTGSGDQQAAAEVAELLGYLALALEQAGAYVRETRISLADYLDRLRQYPVRALAKGRPRDRNPADTVATTWQVSLERVGRTPGAAALLEACAFLAPDDIPRKLFTELVDGQPKDLVELATDSFAFDDVVAALLRYSLVTATHQTLTVHRLVQAVVRDGLSPEFQRHWAAAATRLVTAAFPDGSNDVRTWPACARLLPHVLAVVDHAQAYGVEPVATALLLNEAGLYLWSRGQYQQAWMLHEQALAIRGRELGDDDPDTLWSMSNLAETRRALGELRAARRLHIETLVARRRVLGHEHPYTLISMSNLAETRRALGKLRGARRLHERTLAARRRVLGDDHPDTLWSMHGLAMSRKNLGDVEGARQGFEQTLAARKRVLGDDHPETLWTLYGLAATHRDLGNLQRALEVHEQTLTIRRRVLGDDHPDTLASMNNLAQVHRDLDQL